MTEREIMEKAREVAGGRLVTRSMKGDRARWLAVLAALDLAVVELGGDSVCYPFTGPAKEGT